MSKLKFSTLALLLAGLMFLCISCSGYLSLRDKEPQSVVTTLRVVEPTRSLAYLPQYVALEQGFFLEQDLKVELTTVSSPNAALAALANGRADVVLTGPEHLLRLHASAEDPPLAIAALNRTDDSLLLARKIEGDFSWENLRGRSIICSPPNSAPGIILEGSLRMQKIIPHRDLNLFNTVPETLMVGAYLAGSGSYIQLTEPAASMLELDGQGTVVAFPGALTGDIPAGIYVTNQQFIATSGETLQKFTNAIYKAQLWLQEQPLEELEAVAGAYLSWDQKVLHHALERYHKRDIWTMQPTIDAPAFANFQELMATAGELLATVQYKAAVNNKYADQALQNVVYPPEGDQQ